MKNTFNSLLDQLELTQEYKNTSQLEKLKEWCKVNISQDRVFQDTPAIQYSKYYALVKNYERVFLPNASSNHSEKIKQFDNLTTIQYAAKQGYDCFIKHSKYSKTQLDEADAFGMTPLHLSATHGFFHTTRELVKKGASALQLNKLKELPIHKALFVPLTKNHELMQRKVEIFKLLYSCAPNSLKEVDGNGNSLLHLMTIYGFNNLISILINRDTTFAFQKNKESQYPIHTAILNNQTEAVKLLLTIKGVAELRDSKDLTPLHFAARYGEKDMVLSCIEATSNINIPDRENRTPLDWAASEDNQEALDTLKKHGALESVLGKSLRP